MATQKVVWTVLPHGRVETGRLAGRLRVSVVVSPRLTPQTAAEQTLASFADWRNWPKTLEKISLKLRLGTSTVALERISTADAGLWDRLLPGDTPVAGFVFKDMSQVNLRSFPVRNVLGLLREHYGKLAVDSGSTHPTLLPWRSAHPTLKGMLTQLGTETQTINFGHTSIDVPVPGFDRFFDEKNREGIETRLTDLVFGPRSRFRAKPTAAGVGRLGDPVPGAEVPVRALPPDWTTPAGAGTAAPVMSQFKSGAEYALYQANRFYRREPLTAARVADLKAQGQLRRPRLENIPPSPSLPDWDFHRIVASYADYPQVLRRLGLVIDCVLPAGSPIDQALAGSATAQGLMGLEVSWGDPHAPADDSRPRTAWQADKARFTTRPRTSDHERGMLRLRQAHDRWNEAKESQFDVFQVDPDGGALKTVDFLLTAQRLVAKSLALGKPGDVTYTTGDKQPVAALRSNGLGVSRHGRAQQVALNAASAALKNPAIAGGGNASADVVLFTEDVLRGYRVDVQPLPGGVPGRWHSLCRRNGEYRFAGTSDALEGLVEDEGYVKGASTTSGADGAPVDPDDHYLHETMFKWAGWSLVAPRPGRTLRSRVDSESGVQGEVPEDVTDEAEKGNGLAVTFTAAKGSLPKLRFGIPYRFRARVVDLAGNSLAHDDPSLETDPDSTQPVVYTRFEPVDPPALVQRARLSEGESLERMVIRSNWNQDTKAFLATEPFAEAITLPASADFEYPVTSERHVVPPKASQLQCEQHALFDPMFASPATIKSGYAIAAREAGTLYDQVTGSDVELVTPQSLASVATTSTVPPALPTPSNPTGDRLAPGQYVIHREAIVKTPYLPDAAAGGIAIRASAGHTIPGVTGPVVFGTGAEVVSAPNQELVLLVRYDKSWPDTRGLRIVVAERKAALTDPGCNEQFADDGAPKWDPSKRVLTFFVAKGRIVRLRYASFADKRQIEAFGLPAWVGSAGNRAFVRDMALLGCEWMMTPYRSLVFVHATQQPVCAPEFLVLQPIRAIGDQHARLEARLRMHGPSTGKFEVEATWKEWVDDPAKPGPELIVSHGQLGEVLLPENHVNQFGLGAAVDAQKPAQGSGEPRARGDRHEFGDTRFRMIDYTIRATTRFREYLPEAIYAQRDLITRVGPVGEGPKMAVGADDDPGAPVLRQEGALVRNTLVPASAPPDDPYVLYTVPTFRWSSAPDTNSLTTTRLGNGLRVWLDRPWFSSGNGELLGVIILGENRPFTDIPSSLVPLVTQWGLDPLWDTALPKHRTSVNDFPARVADEAVKLREFPDTTVHVVGHRVRWDDDRRLWYCDIELNPGGSYMPFVRLALVRYQPNALDDAKISKVALAEFSQVLPRRRAVFERTTRGPVRFALHGVVPEHGPMKFPLDSEFQDVSFPPPLGSSGESGRNSIELVLQTRPVNIDSDLAWTDVQTLASGILGNPPPAPPVPPVVSPVGTVTGVVNRPPVIEPIVRPPATGVATGGATVVRPGMSPVRITRGRAAATQQTAAIGSAVNLGRIPSPGLLETGPIGTMLDPAVWEATVTVPDVGNKPARIVVREYERYYTDRTVPEKRGNTTFRRRVVEERLVYTAFFNL